MSNRSYASGGSISSGDGGRSISSRAITLTFVLILVVVLVESRIICICVHISFGVNGLVWFGLVSLFKGILNFVGYLMRKTSSYKDSRVTI